MHTPVQRVESAQMPGQMPNSMLEKEGGTTQRIAHIDDDPDIRDTVKRILDANGYAVDSYQTMNDFIVSLRNSSSPPDLAILDVMVETMDAGLEAYMGLRGQFPGLHMIFMTSLGEEIRPYFTGLSDEWILIVEKPVEPVSLLSIIRSRLDRSEA
ncbi:response regulator transcription factor [Nitrosovibrio tenuis]|uniref:Response regulator receiver domain-containing protein n=1 Tax=Nitrosovibrio tenuis TaxID=1233 RepID=A0A1H7GBC4_9PROT|nr:response regulator [Nitrosovibrio tenuis]SEK35418.1 Response regulator receiver domain-containing protein [Nitrosovibrio tenuis]